jgi:hypothetical protein
MGATVVQRRDLLKTAVVARNLLAYCYFRLVLISAHASDSKRSQPRARCPFYNHTIKSDHIIIDHRIIDSVP